METNQAFFVIGLTFATIATISCIVAFSIPSWIYTYEDDTAWGISNAGLWQFCLDTFFDPKYEFNEGKPLYGCHWIYSDYLRELRWTVLNPEWYIVTQIMATVNLMLAILGWLSLTVMFCCASKNNCPLIFGICCMFVCTVTGFCEVFLYGLRAKDDEYWKVPNVRQKSLGAGWGMAVVAAMVSLLSLIALLISYLTVRKERRRLKRESMRSLDRAHDSQTPLKSSMHRSY